MTTHLNGEVLPNWVDHNGHMNLAYYVLAFDQATDNFFQSFGIDDSYRRNSNCSTFAGNIHVYYKRELHLAEEFYVDCTLLGFDEKRIRHMNCMFHKADKSEIAVFESLQLHVSLEERRVCKMPNNLLTNLERLQEEQPKVYLPKEVGESITKPSIHASFA